MSILKQFWLKIRVKKSKWGTYALALVEGLEAQPRRSRVCPPKSALRQWTLCTAPEVEGRASLRRPVAVDTLVRWSSVGPPPGRSWAGRTAPEVEGQGSQKRPMEVDTLLRRSSVEPPKSEAEPGTGEVSLRRPYARPKEQSARASGRLGRPCPRTQGLCWKPSFARVEALRSAKGAWRPRLGAPWEAVPSAAGAVQNVRAAVRLGRPCPRPRGCAGSPAPPGQLHKYLHAASLLNIRNGMAPAAYLGAPAAYMGCLYGVVK